MRFTVQRKKNESGLHSSFVSNEELYENPTAVASGPSSNGGRKLDYDRIVDAKLKTYFEKSKENADKFSIEGVSNGKVMMREGERSFLGEDKEKSNLQRKERCGLRRLIIWRSA